MRPLEKNDLRERLIEELREKINFYQKLLELDNIESQEIIKRILFNIEIIIQYIENANIYTIENFLKNKDLF